MPYLSTANKINLKENPRPYKAEELNYLITKLCMEYLQYKGKYYDSINEIVGVLECAKQEFYRRVAAPYEQQKIFDFGDIL